VANVAFLRPASERIHILGRLGAYARHLIALPSPGRLRSQPKEKLCLSAKHPSIFRPAQQLPSLMRLAIDATIAKSALRRGRARLGPSLHPRTFTRSQPMAPSLDLDVEVIHIGKVASGPARTTAFDPLSAPD